MTHSINRYHLWSMSHLYYALFHAYGVSLIISQSVSSAFVIRVAFFFTAVCVAYGVIRTVRTYLSSTNRSFLHSHALFLCWSSWHHNIHGIRPIVSYRLMEVNLVVVISGSFTLGNVRILVFYRKFVFLAGYFYSLMKGSTSTGRITSLH
jgi:hypothetical protein